jgi:hypothetical protein
MLVDNFFANINKYCSRLFYPGDHFKADKTIIQWYGIGGMSKVLSIVGRRKKQRVVHPLKVEATHLKKLSV